jgi:hypothetical protein
MNGERSAWRRHCRRRRFQTISNPGIDRCSPSRWSHETVGVSQRRRPPSSSQRNSVLGHETPSRNPCRSAGSYVTWAAHRSREKR